MLLCDAEPLGQVERAYVLLERGPITFVAAFFAISCGILFWILTRTRDRHARELAAVNSERLKMAIEQTTLFTRVLSALEQTEAHLGRRKVRRHDKPEGE